jgi:hypothetical protein
MHTFYGSSKAFVKEVMAEITDQPHYNTLFDHCILEEKGFVSHNAFGKHAPILSYSGFRL